MSLFENALLEIVYTSRKKTVAIQVEHNKIKILAPKKTSQRFINMLLSKRQIWIEQKLQEKKIAAEHARRRFVEGSEVLLLGREISLAFILHSNTIQVNKKEGLSYLDFGLPTHVLESSQFEKEEYIKKKLIAWYKNQAEQLLTQRTQYYAEQLGVIPTLVKTKDYKSRWGCCSFKKEIFYNWKIIMAPQEIIDYIVIHELCHILEHNHSKRYWGHVARMDEDYIEHRNWLKSHGYKLEI